MVFERSKRELLKSADSRLRALVNNLPDKVFLKDRNLTYVLCNRGMADDLGIDPEKCIGKTDFDFFDAALAERYRADDTSIVESGQTQTYDEEYVIGGTTYTVRTTKIPVRDAEGEIVGVLGQFHDVTFEAQVLRDRGEREKELACLFRVGEAAESAEKDLATFLHSVVDLLPPAFQYPERTTGLLAFDGRTYECGPHGQTTTRLTSQIVVNGEAAGHLEVGYVDPAGEKEDHPFLIEEQRLLDAAAQRVGKVVERVRALEEIRARRAQLEAEVSARTEELERQVELTRRQSEEILELSTPVLQVTSGVLVVPLIGSLDSHRTQQFMETLLQSIVDTVSETVLIDITGVPAIDTQTAQHLMDTIAAIRLLGADVILTGVSPAIAQTLVHLGVDLSTVETKARLADGIEHVWSVRNTGSAGTGAAREEGQ